MRVYLDKNVSRRRNSLFYAIMLGILFSWSYAHSQTAALDPSFDGDGIKIISGMGDGRQVLQQGDGKLIVIGMNGGNYAVARLNLDATSDNSFDGDGIRYFDFGGFEYGWTGAIQNDGKILVLGAPEWGPSFHLLRLNADGSNDNTFDGDGIVSRNVGISGVGNLRIAIQSDGKILVSYTASSNNTVSVTRINTDGSTDTGFGTNGIASHSLYSGRCFGLGVQSDGKIIIGGEGNGVFVGRLNTSGSIDNTFGINGKTTVTFGYYVECQGLAIQPDDKIVQAGFGNNAVQVIRYNTNGSLDNSFDSDGRLSTEMGSNENAWGVSIANGKVIVSGNEGGRVFAIRYNSDGSFDTSFGPGYGFADYNASYALGFKPTVLSNGNIAVVGYAPGSGAISMFKANWCTTCSAGSDIALTSGFTYPTNIQYANFQATSLTDQNSVAVLGLTLRDGGASANDDDLAPTFLNSITLSLTNSSAIRRIALFDGATKLSEVAGSASVTFSGLNITANDNASKNFTVRVSYITGVTDNSQNQLTITSTTTGEGGSTMSQSNAGGAQSSLSGDDNRIEVIANRVRFIAQPTNVEAGAIQASSTVEAIDANNNRDLDFTGSITVSNGKLNNSPVAASAVNGVATFSTLTYNAIGTGDVLTAASGSFTTGTSNGFSITPNALSDIVINPFFTYPTNIPFAQFQATSLTEQNSVAVMSLTVRDGGENGNDADNVGTNLTSLTLSVTGGGGMIRRIALFDGSTKLSEVNSSSTVSFTGFTLTVPDNGTKNITVRVSYITSVGTNLTDNLQSQFTLSGATANTAGSGLRFSYSTTTSYCNISMPYYSYGYAWITNVSFADMTNTSGMPTQSQQTYFSNKTANVTAGQPSTFTMNMASNYGIQYGIAAWIDYNRNNIFEDAERLFMNEAYNNSVFTTTITIPANAINGMTRMRVFVDYYYVAGAGSNSCSAVYGYGEVEDYNVNITGGTPPPTPPPTIQSSIAGDNNRIEVVADRLIFSSTLLSNVYEQNIQAPSSQGIRFEARDAFGNRDFDFSGQATLSNAKLVNSPVSANAANGIVDFTALTFNDKGANESVFASSGTLASATATNIIITGNRLSDIIETPGFVYSSNIRYDLPENQLNDITQNSVAVFGITIRDGGVNGDADTYPTVLTQLQVQITSGNATHIKRLALYDGTTEIAEVAAGVSANQTVTFSGFSYTIPDNSTRQLTLRASFRAPIDDNAQLTYRITGALADINVGGSTFSNHPSLTLANQPISNTTGDINRLEAIGDRLFFTQQPASHLLGNPITVSLRVQDALGTTERDFISIPVSINNAKLNNAPLTQSNFSGGASNTVTFTGLTFNATGANETISASAPGLLSATSNSFNITSSNQSVLTAQTGYAYSSNINYMASANQGNNVTSSSVGVMGFTLKDGPIGQNDADNAPTIITSLTLNVTNPTILQKLALYDGNTELAEVSVSGNQVVFNNLSITAMDNGTKNFELKATYTASVIDNTQNQYTVSGVTANGAVGSTFSSTDGSIPQTTCTLTHNFQECSLSIGIGRVELGTLDNSSGCVEAPGYTFFNNIQSQPFTAGQTVNYRISPLSSMTVAYTNVCSAWIDFNGNGTFEEPQERIVTSQQLNPNTPITGTVTIPLTSSNGNVRFRVRTMNSGTMAPCGTVNYGETEDYIINITGGTGGTAGTGSSGTAQSPITGDINRIEVNGDGLYYTVQPTDVEMLSTMNPSVQVSAIDAFGNIDRDFTGTLTLSHDRMNNSPMTASAVNGTATFSPVSFFLPGNDQYLTATSSTLGTATSDIFQIWVKKIVWLNSDDINQSDNTTIQTWADAAGNDDNAIQNNSASRPTFRNNATDNINGHPIVQGAFGRALGMAARDEVNGGGEKVIFAVIRTGSNTVARQVLVDFGGIANGFNMYLNSGRLYAGAWDNNSWWVNNTVTTNRTYLAQFVYDGTRLRLSLSTPGFASTINESNFSDTYISPSANLGAVGSAQQQTKYHNGVNINAGYSDFFTGKIAEIVVLNTSHVDGRTQIFDYLNEKYNIGATSQPLSKEGNSDNSEVEFNEETEDPFISIHPNPIQKNGIINYVMLYEGKYHLSLQDLLGNTVMTIAEGTQKAGTYTAECNTEGLSSGMYRLVLTTATGTISTPMVIQR